MITAAIVGVAGFGAAVITLVTTNYESLGEKTRYIKELALALVQSLNYSHLLVAGLTLIPYIVFKSLVPAHGGQECAAVFENRDDSRYKKTLNGLIRCATSIDVIGIGISQFSELDWGRYMDHAVGVNHALVRMLFLNPCGSHIRMREADERHEDGWLCRQVRAHIRFLENGISRVSERYPYARDLIKYRFYDEYPISNIVIINSKCAFVQPYFYSLRGRANMIIYLHEGHSAEISNLVQEFNRIWRHSVDTPDDMLHSLEKP